MISHSSQARQTNPSMTATDSTCLIRYLEIWQAGSKEQKQLQLCAATAFEVEGSRSIPANDRSVAPGEGLAGSAWKQNAAVVMQDADSTLLREANHRSGVELKALVAIPFVNDRNSITIVVFGIGEGFGGLEVWSRDDRDELSISGSYYHGLESFEFISQYVRFPRGSGLPGNSWKSRRPKMVKDPSVDANFIRSFAKDQAELSVCVGIPVTCEYGSDGAVLLLLSSSQQPIAHHVDILQCKSATPSEDEMYPPVKLVDLETTRDGGNGGNGHSRMQKVCDRLAQSRDVLLLPAGDPCLAAGCQGALVVPFFDKHQIRSALQLSF